MKKLIIIFCLLLPLTINAQKISWRSGLQFPVQYFTGIEYKPVDFLSFNVHAGIITDPHDEVILTILESLGTDDEYIRMINGAFEFGFVFDAGARFQFGKYYAGTYLQNIRLTGADAPGDVIQNYYGVDFSNYPSRTTSDGANELKLSSNLSQLGIVLGRRINLPVKKLSLAAEFSISMNIDSNSRLSSSTQDLKNLSQLIDQELKIVYQDYAYIPAIALLLVYDIK